MSKSGKYYIPPLTRISPAEAQSIVSCFRLYDYNATGRIPRHLAAKLAKQLGFNKVTLPADVSAKEFLLTLDRAAPEKEPHFENEMFFFHNMATTSDYSIPTHSAFAESTLTGTSKRLTTTDAATATAAANTLTTNTATDLTTAATTSTSMTNSLHKKQQPQEDTMEVYQGPPIYTGESLSRFYESLGRPPLNPALTKMGLMDMIEYDNCSLYPQIPWEDFEKILTLYTKKYKILKDFK